MDLSFYRGKRVFVTGHTGFKGTWLCRMLINAGAIVTGYSLQPPTNPSLFELARLEDRMTSKVGLLSGGQRQALTLLMATMVTPKILLLDEHTAALDPATAEKVLELTKSIIKERNITALMVTHNMHQAIELGNRILMMDQGHIILDIEGEEKAKLTVEELLEKFKENAGKALDNDRILTAE